MSSEAIDVSPINPEVMDLDTETSAMVPVNPASGSLTPVFGAGEMVGALQAYLSLQQTLDTGLKDCIMTIQGKKFRKRAYWRAVATAFDLNVECTQEERSEIGGALSDGRADGGWFVTYRASTRSGRFRDGDGACFLSEKLDKGGNVCDMTTEHNTRAHAHTRAFNRAVSNLVGFGEVSADEVNVSSGAAVSHAKPAAKSKAKEKQTGNGYASKEGDTRPISEPQRKRMYAIMKGAEKDPADCEAFIKSLGFDSSKDVTREKYDEICTWLETP